MIPLYAWLIATVLLILASLVNDNNLVCLAGAGACAGTAASVGFSILPPIWFEIFLYSSSFMLCLVFVIGPPTAATCQDDDASDTVLTTEGSYGEDDQEKRETVGQR